MKKSRYKHTVTTTFTPQKPDSMASLAEGIADDFNNILTTVMGACTLIDKDDPANGELLQYVALIRTSAERAADLSDRLMRAGKPTRKHEYSGHTPHDSSPVETSGRDKMNCDDIVSSRNIPGGSSS
jgi:nitrogen-specific signal transduction histidine kinase